jgi:hypothetical protein
MLFQSVLLRAEAMIGNVLEQALARALVALPLLVAAGFGTAALSTYVNAKYGLQTGQLIMAGGFAILGLLAMLYVSVVAPATIESGEATTASDDVGTAEGGQSDGSAAVRAFGDAERELVTTMLASAAPVAVPGILRTLIRNLPLVLLILIVAFILSRSGANGSGPENSDEHQGKRVKAMS